MRGLNTKWFCCYLKTINYIELFLYTSFNSFLFNTFFLILLLLASNTILLYFYQLMRNFSSLRILSRLKYFYYLTVYSSSLYLCCLLLPLFRLHLLFTFRLSCLLLLLPTRVLYEFYIIHRVLIFDTQETSWKKGVVKTTTLYLSIITIWWMAKK